MKILVTGNNGYIGSVLTDILSKLNYEVVGLDNNYFKDCSLTNVNKISTQIVKDIRNIDSTDLKGVDAIIHLAALSNDPLGELMPNITEEINYKSTLKLANIAKLAGVKRFVYASSQTMYGVSTTDSELDEDNSEKNPQTAYAATKWKSENELKNLNSDNFTVTSFRPSTVYGASPRLRCDIVYNYFVACAYTTGKVEILSDGTPWRPVVHVRDLCQALIAGAIAPKDIVERQTFNVGIKNGNYTVRELAEAANKVIPKSKIVFLKEHNDPRTYRVSFNKILNVLGEFYKPQWNLENGAKELVDFFKKINFTENDFRKKCNRLKHLKALIENKKISKDLKWL